ncbi:MAG TPA: hypothetical protein VGQ39_09125, partial [Pyrinomonadaceae bacterium]|nr:hypothetical protein [Pyrinomonadaceae bacterium]
LIDTWKPSGAGFFGNISDDGNYVIAGGGAIYGKKSVEIWSASDKKRIGELTDFRSGLFALAIAHSAKFFALAGGDYGSGGDLSLWSLSENPREVGYVSFGEFPIDDLAFSPDDRTLAAASNDHFVLLYDVARIRGPEIKRQDYALCGEILKEGDKSFIVPLSKVPRVMDSSFNYAWRLEIVNADLLAGIAAGPIALDDWNIESRSDEDRARIVKFRRLQAQQESPNLGHIVFGDIQNPGWNEGSIVKIYGDGSFVATNNPGRCVAYGSLAQFKTDFESVRKRLVDGGLLTLSRNPLSSGAAHFHTRFIELASAGSVEVRSDVADREGFTRLLSREEAFINSVRMAGMKPSAPN